MNKILRYILSELLHYANTSPKDNFYILKSKLLTRYAIPIAYDCQYISKPCYRCANGILQESYYFFGNRLEPGDICPDCNGTGVYDSFYVLLRKYKLGKRVFHTPLERSHFNKFYMQPTIEGYINHRWYKYYVADEAWLWLLLLFDIKNFFSYFGKTAYPGTKFTPLIILSNLAFIILNLPNSLMGKLRELKYKHIFSEKESPF